MVLRAWLSVVALTAAFAISGCAANPTPSDDDGGGGGADSSMDGGTSTPPEDGGSTPQTGPCGTAGGSCCIGRICELGLSCGRGDRCCIQPGSSALCDAASDCCGGLACEDSRCCAPRDTTCTASSDCCDGLVCGQTGICQRPEDADPGNPTCGQPGTTCCAGFTCRGEAVCNTSGQCEACGGEGEACCDGITACNAPSLGCDIVRDGSGTVTGTECVNVTDPVHACGGIDQVCCDGPTGNPTDCEADLVCRGGTCLRPEDTGFQGAPCGPRGGCDPGLVCDRRTDPDGLCEMPPEDCGRDGQMCCDLGGSENSCTGSLHCQFGDCSTCRGPSLTCLLGGLLPGQECCAGSVCRPAPLVPRCCMGEGGQCENSLDCCGLMACRDGACSCSRENSFCLDSSECCDGLICEGFMCKPSSETMCKEIGTGCTGSAECCAGATCSETRTEPTAPAVRQCCGSGSTSCTTHEDCCGQMLCEDGECQCVPTDGLCDRDVDCCGDDICLVGACREHTDGCKRERQVCSDTDLCCDGLSCFPHYSMGDTSYCCVSQGLRCRDDAECCGKMTCDSDSELCQPVAEGQECDTQFDCAEGLSCMAPAEGSSGPHRCQRGAD